MRKVCTILGASALAIAFAGGVAIAQDHHDDQDHRDQQSRHDDQNQGNGQYHHDDQDHHDHDQYVHHDDWRKGRHLQHEDWDRGQRVDDWRAHHLRHPPAGYEWRHVDGQYVCANPDGVIFQVTIGR